MKLNISKPDDPRFEVELSHGQILFVVGANGSGKSALIDRLAHLNVLRPLVRVGAHRQTWFDSHVIRQSPLEISQRQASLTSFDSSPEARYKDPQPAWRVDAALAAISEATRRAEHQLWEDIRGGAAVGSNDPRFSQPPLENINLIFKDARLNVQVALVGSSYMARRGASSFGANAMSDGERAAFLIAGGVLTAAPGSCLLIDEPERHLHRSISSPLLSGLFAMRKDCAFVVSTHDLDLPLENPSAQVLVLRSCTFQGAQGLNWDFDLLPGGAELPEWVRRQILGARRNILFVEGEDTLDKPLYEVLFPEATVVACGGCREVERRVKGMRGTRDKHWITACGIVDRDFRDENEIAALAARGIYTFGAYSVESIYYRSDLQREAAQRLENITGADAAQAVDRAKEAAVNALRKASCHLVCRAAKARYRDHAIRIADDMQKAEIDPKLFVEEETNRLQELLKAKSLDEIAGAYPVRESRALDSIASSLGFKNRGQYEAAVVKLLSECGALCDQERARFAPILREFGPRASDSAAPESA